MKKTSLNPIQVGAIFGFLAVAFGAFGSHLVKDIVSNGRYDTYQTAVKYQMYHAIVILMLKNTNKNQKIAMNLFITGIIFFSGSLYLLVLLNISIFGAITPLGGIFLLVGWVYLFKSSITATDDI